ncbi:GTP-binding protein [Romeria aff. gracilis LEGE 07310]|uniref:GTP-binding protein n=1 Tax=Vasconcelosia minhoensis LEGE 07310 TaxID=915328 RepID=A0A8J7AW76_9CYAN|nr:GTP-binding protein [Romeria gracilis]MBE9076902.1 GTP-binding protein [Romeria aff. gracilis LEGE 07310]
MTGPISGSRPPADNTLTDAAQLAQTLAEFEALAADLHYQQAIETVQQLIQQLDLTPRERAGLESEIQSLDGLLSKLEHTVIHIAVFGLVGRGKSSLLNALVGQPIFETGPLHGVTQRVESVRWTAQELQLETETATVYRATLPGLGESRVELVDTPGIDEVGGEARQSMAQRIAQQADLILFAIAGDLTQVEHEALSQLHRAGKPIILVFNKVDQYAEAERQTILQQLRNRHAAVVSPDNIVLAAADPLVTQAVRQADGQTAIQVQRGSPQIDALKLKILDLLQREGKALVALSTMLYADRVNQQLVARKLAIRDRAAEDALWQVVMTKAVAVAVNPVMVVDLLSGAAIDIALIIRLSRLYGLEMTQQSAAQLLQKIALAMGGLTLSELVVTLGLSSLKSALGAAAIATGGLALTPYFSVAVTQAAVAGVSTYAIGQIAKTYLANGATWGPEGPKAVVERILDTLDEDSILNRIRDQLRSQLDADRVSKPQH